MSIKTTLKLALEAKASKLGLTLTEYIKHVSINSLEEGGMMTVKATPALDKSVAAVAAEKPPKLSELERDVLATSLSKILGRALAYPSKELPGDLEKVDEIQFMLGWGRIDRGHIPEDLRNEFAIDHQWCAGCGKKAPRIETCIYCQTCHDERCLGIFK
jgi:hypothetical protein